MPTSNHCAAVLSTATLRKRTEPTLATIGRATHVVVRHVFHAPQAAPIAAVAILVVPTCYTILSFCAVSVTASQPRSADRALPRIIDS